MRARLASEKKKRWEEKWAACAPSAQKTAREEKKRRRRRDGLPVPRRPSPRAALPSRSPSQLAKLSPEPAVLLSHQAKPDGPPSRPNLFELVYTPLPFFFFF